MKGRGKSSRKDQVANSKKTENPYARQMQRNQLIFIILSVIIILSMVITSLINL